MADWQPIETAPKDGRHVLVGYWHAGAWVRRVACFDIHFPNFNRWLTVPISVHIQPTHWLDTPVGPKP